MTSAVLIFCFLPAWLKALLLLASFLNFLYYVQQDGATNSKIPSVFSIFSSYEETNVLADHVLFKLLANIFLWLLAICRNVYAAAVEMLCLICFGPASYPFPLVYFWSLSFSPRLKAQGYFSFLSSVPELPIHSRKMNNVNSVLKSNLYLTLSTRSDALAEA